MGSPAMMDPPPNLQPGAVLDGRYQLEGLLGAGGVGWVFRAKHRELQSEVAIKVLQTTFAAHSLMRPRFVREARAMAALKHPHIVTITDFSVDGDQPYIVMELLEGKTLHEVMNEGPFDPERARRVMGHVLDGLAYAHGKGFVHRDLKPDNLFLLDLKSDDAFPKILDFGFVKLTSGEEQAPSDVLTRSGIAFGTPAYMSPEQATGAPADRRSDLYSLAIVFYEMLAGQRPYQGSLPEIVRQHLTAPVPTFEQLGLPHRESQPLYDFFARAMAKEADERFDDAAEMKEALLALPIPYLTRNSQAPASPIALSSAPTVAAVVRSRPSGGSRVASEVEPAPRRRGSLGRRLVFLGLLLTIGLAVVLVPLGADMIQRLEGAITSVAGAPAPSSPLPMPGAAEPDKPQAPAAPIEEPEAVRPAAVTVPGEVGTAHDTEVAESVVTPEVVAAGAPAADDTAVDNPWQHPAPGWISRARRRVLSNRDLGTRTEDALKRYARSHRDDPRPHLLLAASFHARGWDASSMERYDLAYRVNRTATADPRMLHDLVSMSARSTDPRRAAGIVQRIFGARARAALDAAIEDASYTREEVARLRALRQRL